MCFLFVVSHKTNNSDFMAIKDVLDDSYYERFDRYDSDVVEQFIIIYLNIKDNYLKIVDTQEI